MCVNGLEPIQQGRIVVDGTEVHARATDLNRLRRKIGIVFQQLNAFPHLTVLENVMLAPRKVLGKSRAEAEAIAVRQLKHVGLGEKLGVYPSKLRRPAAARGHRPRARDVARLHAARRSDLRARSAARGRGCSTRCGCCRAKG
jgi:ABC-type polar amino acid transport system ATPase subunit